MLGFLVRLLPFWVREPLLIVVGSVLGLRITCMAVSDRDWPLAAIGAVFLVFTAVRVHMVIHALRLRRAAAEAPAADRTPTQADTPDTTPAPAPGTTRAPGTAPAPTPVTEVTPPTVSPTPAQPQASAPTEKEPNAWGQAAAAMGLFAVLAGVLWLGPELLPSTAGTASPAAGCGEPTEEVRSNAYRQTPRAVTGYDLCEALDTPDLARLLGTPDEVVTGTTFASGTAPLTGERVPQPSAQVSFDTYTVDITATYNHLTVDQYVKLMHYGDETDVERLKVLDQRPAVLSSDRTMQYRIDLGGSATGGPVEQGPMARTLTVAFDRKDSGGYFDISVWSDSGLLPDDSVLVGIAEKIIPALEDRTAH